MFQKIIKNRFVIILIFSLYITLFNNYFTGSFLPSSETKDLWFYSGIFMIIFSILFIEPYYSSPKNVITNVTPLLLLFISIENDFPSIELWLIIFFILLTLLIFSVTAVSLIDENKSPTHFKNKIAEWLKILVVLLGKGKVLYSGIFLIFLYLNVTSIGSERISNSYFFILIIAWGIILLINPKDLNSSFKIIKKGKGKDALGEIFGIQSRKIFLVKLYNDRKSGVKKFDIVRFRYSMQDDNDLLITGIIFDTYLLNQEKWAKVLQLGEIKKEVDFSPEKNTVYKVSEPSFISLLKTELKINDFVGIIIQGTSINKIKFEYSKLEDNLQEGDLVELTLGDKKIFYQVIGGVTEKEKLEDKNETSFIEGDAIQLGEWDNADFSFKKFGWVAPNNTPLFKVNKTNIPEFSCIYPYHKIGNIPGTKLPSIINLDEAISHHMAILGVTGSGKSHLARKLIQKLKQDTKIICVDFTGEWKKNIEPDNSIVLNSTNLEDFLNGGENKIGIVELPAISNTTAILQATENLFERMFIFAKDKYQENHTQKICLVLEEAHTITPESSFLGDTGEYGSNKALVNKMSQIALQGRKYGIGLMVIAQRTANVSKSVLTQCNTVICFQAYDETSFNFISNYIGKNLAETLPTLKKYHAIVAGKGIVSNVPMIIDLS